MTAVTRHLTLLQPEPAPAVDAPLAEALVDALSEAELVDLLLLRFRGFIGAGHPLEEALLLAVGRAA